MSELQAAVLPPLTRQIERRISHQLTGSKIHRGEPGPAPEEFRRTSPMIHNGRIRARAGSPCWAVLETLPASPLDRERTVVTHSSTPARMRRGRGGVTLDLAGGRLCGRTLAALDGWALSGTSSTGPSWRPSPPPGARSFDDHPKSDRDHFARLAGLVDVGAVMTDNGIGE